MLKNAALTKECTRPLDPFFVKSNCISRNQITELRVRVHTLDSALDVTRSAFRGGTGVDLYGRFGIGRLRRRRPIFNKYFYFEKY